MSDRTAARIRGKAGLVALAMAASAVITLAVAELGPARSLGLTAGAPAITHRPSGADIDFAHGAFERYRDRVEADARP